MNENVIREIDNISLIIKKYNIKNIDIQIKYMENLKEQLTNKNNISVKDRLNIYKVLFPPRGGLSDIYYWDNNFEVRKEINQKISLSKTVIADFLLGEL